MLHELMRALPRERLIYLGDTGRYPYGTKSAETVRSYSVENTEFLLEKGIKLLVVACNTASSVALDVMAERAAVPIIGVIEPGAAEAVRRCQGRGIAVLATEATSTRSVGAISAITLETFSSSTMARMAYSYLSASASPTTSTGL